DVLLDLAAHLRRSLSHGTTSSFLLASDGLARTWFQEGLFWFGIGVFMMGFAVRGGGNNATD
ncbi:MAG: hypothetical protein COB10_09845, partial [Planctomycetota bacterium]